MFVWLCIVAPASSQHLSRLIRFRRAGAAGYAERSSPWEEKRVRGARLMKQGNGH